MSNKIGLYIHIPFCASKCPYCDFFSGKGSEADYDEYVNTLIDSFFYWSKRTDKPVSSIYFGGGTPSILGAERLSFLLNEIKSSFNVEASAEITAEVNPDSGRHIDFESMKSAGFNRISVGLQSAVETELNALVRIHRANDAKVTVERAINAGISNTSLDLMLGIPHQTEESLKSSIDFCADCGVKHISAYILKIEEGTPFYKNKENLRIADEDMQADLYLFAVEYLKEKGFEQYEISNFAKKGYESKHNICYWNCDEYIGIGPSAHSFLNGKRFCYGRSMKDFENNIITETDSGGNESEYLMLRLRLREGVVFDEYKLRFGHSLSAGQMKKIELFSNAGYMERSGSRACFTPKGFLVSNSIIAELI